jgi:hypothetical protein
MYNRRVMGSVILIASVVFLLIYAWLLFISEYSMLVIKYTAFALILCVTALLAWLGLSMATTKGKSSDD